MFQFNCPVCNGRSPSAPSRTRRTICWFNHSKPKPFSARWARPERLRSSQPSRRRHCAARPRAMTPRAVGICAQHGDYHLHKTSLSHGKVGFVPEWLKGPASSQVVRAPNASSRRGAWPARLVLVKLAGFAGKESHPSCGRCQAVRLR
jgi:hypothetical protein